MNDWFAGNSVRLLRNGEQFFPRVFESIASAEREVIIETFILFEDKVGMALHAALCAAARRGVQVDLTVDGWGSPDLSEAFVGALTAAGARLHVFDPGPRPFGWRPKLLRRMHRKIVVIDGQLAFLGGMNYSADHLMDFGPTAKLDYAVEVQGPIVAVIHRFTHGALANGMRHERRRRWWRWRHSVRALPQELTRVGNAQAQLVVRDNVGHHNDIERHYRQAIHAARQRVIIANAYFFPGYRLVRELRRAARRGVDVRLILQGQPDMAIVKTVATTLYRHLLRAGVRIFEYVERPLHGKVAVIDADWSTVGSSNLDPLSLALNLEANLIIRDQDFNRTLAGQLQALMTHQCKEVDAATLPPMRVLDLVRTYIAFHVMRKFPQWAGWLPLHQPHLKTAVDGRFPSQAAAKERPWA